MTICETFDAIWNYLSEGDFRSIEEIALKFDLDREAVWDYLDAIQCSAGTMPNIRFERSRVHVDGNLFSYRCRLVDTQLPPQEKHRDKTVYGPAYDKLYWAIEEHFPRYAQSDPVATVKFVGNKLVSLEEQLALAEIGSRLLQSKNDHLRNILALVAGCLNARADALANDLPIKAETLLQEAMNLVEPYRPVDGLYTEEQGKIRMDSYDSMQNLCRTINAKDVEIENLRKELAELRKKC